MEKVYRVDSIDYVYLGRCGENLARTVRIDVSAWLARWPDAAINLLHRPRGSEEYYIAGTALDGGMLTWVIKAADVAAPGRGKLEIRAIQGETVKKSATGVSIVDASLTGSEGAAPDPQKPWVDGVLAAAATVETSASRAEQAAVKAEQAAATVETSASRAEQAAVKAEQAAAKGVLTVNGVGPDENGNVQVSGLPESGNPGDVLVRTEDGAVWLQMDRLGATDVDELMNMLQ